MTSCAPLGCTWPAAVQVPGHAVQRGEARSERSESAVSRPPTLEGLHRVSDSDGTSVSGPSAASWAWRVA